VKLADYRGITALVTGASSGIGRELALRLAARGARLALVARRKPALDDVAEEVAALGGRALAVPCDVSDGAAVVAAAEQVHDAIGPVDLLVSNAGYGHHRSFLEWDVADMERVMRVNYLGALYFTKALLPAMVERRRGWLVFMASIAGRIAPPEEAAYAASKFALVGLAEALSLEVEPHGVHVLTVCPGVIRTPFFDEEAIERMPRVARRQMIEPGVVADQVIDALARGRRELTVPRMLRVAGMVRALAPAFTRRQVRRTTLGRVRREP
jgi:hypothetical protein